MLKLQLQKIKFVHLCQNCFKITYFVLEVIWEWKVHALVILEDHWWFSENYRIDVIKATFIFVASMFKILIGHLILDYQHLQVNNCTFYFSSRVTNCSCSWRHSLWWCRLSRHLCQTGWSCCFQFHPISCQLLAKVLKKKSKIFKEYN